MGAERRRARRLPPDTDLFEYLLALPAETRRVALARFGPQDAEEYDCAWEEWAHRGQLPPDGEWRSWVLMAGRGFGKTLAGAQWIAAAVAKPETVTGAAGEALQIALIGATLEDARRVMVEGRSGLLAVAPEFVAEWHPSLYRLSFTTGAVATLFSGASPDRLRGPEHHLAWCDELAKWERPGDSWDMLQLGLRLGPRPRALVTTTPRPGEALRRIMDDADTMVTRGTTRANPHTPAAWKQAVERVYAGTRLGRQELDGELLTDTPGALWTVETLERCRLLAPLPLAGGAPATPLPQAGGAGGGAVIDAPVNESRTSPPPTPPAIGRGELASGRGNFTRICIGVDPPSGNGTCGIVGCARDEAGIAHVLADHSVTGLSPEGWARAVADAVGAHAGLDPSRALVVAEVNQGGKMVEAVLHGADPGLHVRRVTATVGKSHRAEPVARLFEAGQVVLHGRMPQLEAQLLGMIAGGGYEGPGQSPDRADAMVWALTELMLGRRKAPQVRGF